MGIGGRTLIGAGLAVGLLFSAAAVAVAGQDEAVQTPAARGGEILRVAAIGDGDTNIDLVVRDARGAVVCRDGFGDHYPVCTVSPRAGGQMQVDVVNRGDVWTKVQVLSN